MVVVVLYLLPLLRQDAVGLETVHTVLLWSPFLCKWALEGTTLDLGALKRSLQSMGTRLHSSRGPWSMSPVAGTLLV